MFHHNQFRSIRKTLCNKSSFIPRNHVFLILLSYKYLFVLYSFLALGIRLIGPKILRSFLYKYHLYFTSFIALGVKTITPKTLYSLLYKYHLNLKGFIALGVKTIAPKTLYLLSYKFYSLRHKDHNSKNLIFSFVKISFCNVPGS